MPRDAPPDVEDILRRAVAEVCHVPPPRDVAAWADAERMVAAETGSPWPGRWRTDRVPYLREIMQVATLAHPARRVTMLKSAQIGGSEAGLNLIGQVMAETPAPVLVMLPSIDMMLGYNRLKLDPLIQATPALSRRVSDIVSRDDRSSTVTFKRFPGGYLQLLTANSSANLQMRSARVLILEEISEYPDDVDGRGDPVAQIEARATMYSGREKIIDISTPAMEGACRVTALYEQSSRGRYEIACPHCDHRQPLEWEGLKWPKGSPAEAAYHCAGCGAAIDHADKARLIAAGTWRHDRPELVTVHAGYALNGLYSPVVSWGDLAAQWEAAQGDHRALKVFVQQKLGRSWREAGEAPDWERLYERRETWPRLTVPANAVVLTAGIDVQRDRIEMSVWAWGRERRSWLIDHVVIPGSPAAWRTWEQVAAMLETRYGHANGGAVGIARAAVDSGDGVSTAEVYAFVRRVGSSRIVAVKGRAGQAELVAPGGKSEVSSRGRRVGRMRIWLVGVGTAKGELYGQLRLSRGDREAGEEDPPGYVHLSEHVATQEYCRQLTAEELRRVKTRQGYWRLEWTLTRPRNEALDCRVYARAAAALHGIDRWTEARWTAEEQSIAEAAMPPRRASVQLGLAVPQTDDADTPDGPVTPEIDPPPVPPPSAARLAPSRPRAWGAGSAAW
jgi:phage terminase large subunit GpA-like protein